MSGKIHPTAIIDPSAQIAGDVEIGPYCFIGPEVKIGAGTVLHANAQVMKNSEIGSNNQIFPGAIIGGAPQDLGYKDEPTRVVIGDNNVIREFVTINRGTTKQDGVTIVGSNNMFMAYVHVAHDDIIGNNCVFANLTQLAGHVTVEDNVFTSAGAMVHQFCTLGTRCFLAPNTMANSDCIPGIMYFGHPAAPRALNLVGLKRGGYTGDALNHIKKAFKLLCRGDMNKVDAIKAIEQEEWAQEEFVRHMVERVKTSLNSAHSRSGQGH